MMRGRPVMPRPHRTALPTPSHVLVMRRCSRYHADALVFEVLGEALEPSARVALLDERHLDVEDVLHKYFDKQAAAMSVPMTPQVVGAPLLTGVAGGIAPLSMSTQQSSHSPAAAALAAALKQLFQLFPSLKNGLIPGVAWESSQAHHNRPWRSIVRLRTGDAFELQLARCATKEAAMARILEAVRAWPAYRASGRYRLSRHVYVEQTTIDGLVQLAAAAKAEAEAALTHSPETETITAEATDG